MINQLLFRTEWSRCHEPHQMGIGAFDRATEMQIPMARSGISQVGAKCEFSTHPFENRRGDHSPVAGLYGRHHARVEKFRHEAERAEWLTRFEFIKSRFQIALVVCSVDKAKEMDVDCWVDSPAFAG